jgi:tetratricopeptide (TPR) repeat protein
MHSRSSSRLVLGILMTALSLAGCLAMPGPAAAPEFTTPHVANLRAGPGIDHPVIGTTKPGQVYSAQGRNVDGAWLEICCVGQKTVWIDAGVTTFLGNVMSIPLARNIPTPGPAPTAAVGPEMPGSCRTPADDKIKTWRMDLAEITETIRLTPNDPLPYSDRAWVYCLLNDKDKAIADYSTAIEFDPTQPEYFSDRGEVYQARGDYERAVADYSKALKLDPAYGPIKGAWIHNVRGLAYADLGKYDLAIADYDKAVQIKPVYAWAYNNRGLAYAAKGNFERAIADYDSAIEVGGWDIAHCYRGLALKAQGNKTEAMGALRKCIEVLNSGWGSNPEGPGVRKLAESALKELGAQ